MPTQAEKAVKFKKLHELPQTFLLPNAWSPGAARVLELKGFRAIASTSAGYAYWQGLADNAVGLESTIAHLRELCASTSLPVSADLENGFGVEPCTVAETILLAAEAGVVGGSIEDSRNDGSDELYEYGLAVERIRAAAEAAHALPFPFTLTARCESLLTGKPDLKEVIRRLQGYQEAGADVLFAPGLKSIDDMATVVRAIDRPVNVIMGMPDVPYTLRDLERAGARRISVGASLARTAFGAYLSAVDELAKDGSFGYAKNAVGGKFMNDMFGEAPRQNVLRCIPPAR